MAYSVPPRVITSPTFGSDV
jgi:hypothetical protein